MTRRGQRGQVGTEYMLVVSVIVIAVVAASYGFVPEFRRGVNKLGRDVERILSTGESSRNGYSAPSGPTLAPSNYTPGDPFTLPRGPRNAGCASGTACGQPPAPRLGAPLNVCRGGDRC